VPQIDGPNDHLLLNRYLYALRAPRRGDVVVFHLRPENTHLESGAMVKRVIAVAGDRVAINLRGQVVLNGREISEPYAGGPSNRVIPSLIVPAGSLFVLGDNRNASRDSSRWEGSPFVPTAAVVGKAVAVCWPPGRMTLLR
jgi:signal peptidase I